MRYPGGIFGHNGQTLGYTTIVGHNPDSGTTAFFVATNDIVDFTAAAEAVAERLSQGSPEG
jgi:hypothetical protein